MAQRDASFEADNAESRDGDASQKLRYRDNVMFIGERMVTTNDGYRVAPSKETKLFDSNQMAQATANVLTAENYLRDNK